MAPANSSAAGSARRTVWPFVLVGSLVYGANYTDKTVISVVGPHLLTHYGLSKTQLGLLFTAFAVAYAVAQIPIARLVDRVGRRRGVALTALVFGLGTIATGGVAASLPLLLAARIVTGAGEACMPAVTGAVTPWLRRSLRAQVQGIMHAATRIAAAVTVPIAVFLLLQFGIGGPFLFFGVLTIVIALAWYLLYRDHPGSAARARERAPWARMLRSRSIWALCLTDFCYFYALSFFLTWFPTYLALDRHLSLKSLGWLGALPFLGGALGGIVGGRLSDRLSSRWPRTGRNGVVTASLLASLVLMIAAVFVANQTTMIVLFTLAYFTLDATVSVLWALAMDIGGDHAGTTSAWMNTWANIAGIVAPLLFGVLATAGHGVTLPFAITAAVLAVGAALIWLVDPDTRLSTETTRYHPSSTEKELTEWN